MKNEIFEIDNTNNIELVVLYIVYKNLQVAYILLILNVLLNLSELRS